MKLKKQLSYAELTSGIEKKQKMYQKVLDDPASTELQKKTFQMNLNNLNKYAQEVFQAMEEDKRSMGIPVTEQTAAYGINLIPGQQRPNQYVTANNGLNDYNLGYGQLGYINDLERNRLYGNKTSGNLIGPLESNMIIPKKRFATDRNNNPIYQTNTEPIGPPEAPFIIPSGYNVNPYESNNYKDQNVIQPGPVSVPETQSTSVNSSSSSSSSTQYGVDDNGVGYIIPAINMARGIFGKVQTLNPTDYMTTKKLTQSRYDINPQLRDIEASAAISRKNNRTASPTQVMSGNIATSDWEARAKAGLYSNKWNVDQQDRARVEAGNIQLDKENKNIKLQIGDINNQSKAAKDNILQTGMSQVLENYYRGRNDKMTAKQLQLSDEQFNKNLENTKKIYDDSKAENARINTENNAARKYEIDTAYKASTDALNYEKSKNTNMGDGTKKDPTVNFTANELGQHLTGRTRYTGEYNEDELRTIKALDNPDYIWTASNLAKKELGYQKDYRDPKNISKTGAVGYGQLQPSSAHDMGLTVDDVSLKLDKQRDAEKDPLKKSALTVALRDRTLFLAKHPEIKDERFDEAKGVEAAKKLNYQLFTEFRDIRKSTAAYNRGAGEIRKLVRLWGEDWDKHLPQETANHIADLPKTNTTSEKEGNKYPVGTSLGLGAMGAYAAYDLARQPATMKMLGIGTKGAVIAGKATADAAAATAQIAGEAAKGIAEQNRLANAKAGSAFKAGFKGGSSVVEQTLVNPIENSVPKTVESQLANAGLSQAKKKVIDETIEQAMESAYSSEAKNLGIGIRNVLTKVVSKNAIKSTVTGGLVGIVLDLASAPLKSSMDLSQANLDDAKKVVELARTQPYGQQKIDELLKRESLSPEYRYMIAKLWHSTKNR